MPTQMNGRRPEPDPRSSSAARQELAIWLELDLVDRLSGSERSGARLAAHVAEYLRVVGGVEPAQLSVLSVRRICGAALRAYNVKLELDFDHAAQRYGRSLSCMALRSISI